MTTAIIVQARMGSSRLPGKVMRDLAGQPVLAHILARCSAIPGADVVVCAMPDEADSDVLEAVARKAGAATFRGSETDVLSRYAGAARSVDADVVMRVTSDCPLIDPDVCGAVLALREQESADYAANNMPASFPHGLDCEAMTLASLVEAEAMAQEPYDREHVTPWLRRAAHLRRSNHHSGDASLAAHRWTLDYPEDLTFFQQVFAALPKDSPGRMPDILALLHRQPSLSQINSMRGSRAAADVRSLDMTATTPQLDFWRGDFGNAYIDRNDASPEQMRARVALWSEILSHTMVAPPTSILEVGANLGINLRALRVLTGARLHALEPNDKARGILVGDGIVAQDDVRGGMASAIDFPNGAVDFAFTSGVLIHIHPDHLAASLSEIHRCSSRWIACVEYFSDKPEMIPYRGHDDRLFKRDFGGLWLDSFPDLRVAAYGFAWKRVTGLDNLTWWLLEKR